MAAVNWTGTISGTALLVTDTNTVTGNCTINDATTWTLSIETGTDLTLNPVNVSGAFTITVNGKIVGNGSAAARITFKSSVATPMAGSWGGFDLGPVDAASSLTYVIIRDASVGLDYLAGFNADNININYVTFITNDFAIRLSTTTAVTIGAVEITHSCESGSASPCLSMNAAATVSITLMYIHDCGNMSSIFSWSQGTATITTLILINPGNGSITRSAGTPSLTITRLYSFSTHTFFGSWTSGVVDINSGIVANPRGSFFSGCLNQTFTVDEVDFWCEGTRLCASSGPNFNNCYVRGGNNGTGAYDYEFNDTTSGGTVDGIADVNTANFINTDSVLNSRTSPNHPRTFSSVSDTAIGDNSRTINFTKNYPGQVFVVLSTSAQTMRNFRDIYQYSIHSQVKNREIFYTSLGGDNMFNPSAQTLDVSGLTAGTIYYYRVVGIPFGENLETAFWSTEGNFTTSGIAPSSLGAGFINAVG